MGESPNSGDSLPFKEPIDTPELNLGVEPSEAEDVDLVEIQQSSASVIEVPSSIDSEDHGHEISASRLIQQLSVAMESLKSLNLEGFKQIYPVFLVVFGSVIVGLFLLFSVSFLNSMNHLPIVGGLFQGLSELVGLVALVRFITSNLLLQQRRAEVFARIAAIKKDLLGGPD